jgi:hypothetical protein
LLAYSNFNKVEANIPMDGLLGHSNEKKIWISVKNVEIS